MDRPPRPRRTSNSPLWHRIEERWNGIQVGRQGAYSVERVESLEYYCKTTSRTRVFMVCVLTPLPALSVVVLLECLPLRSPWDGWAANWMFWIRLSLVTFILVFVGISELILFVPNLDFTLYKRIIISFGASVAYIGTCICITATHLVGFPVPCIWQFGGLLLGIYLPVMFVIVFGFAPFASSSPSYVYLKRYFRLVIAYMALAGIYPLYKVLYEYVPVSYRAVVLIVLPLWKFGAKHFMMSATHELEDFVPVVVAFTVDFFSALFVSVCISSSGSLYLSALFIAADVGQALLEFREVCANAKTVVELLRRGGALQRSIRLRAESHFEVPDLVAMILTVTRDPSAFQLVSLQGARLRACVPHRMVDEQVERLKTLETSGAYTSNGINSRKKPRRPYLKSRSLMMQVKPIQSASVVPELANGLKTQSDVVARAYFSTSYAKSVRIKPAASGGTSKKMVLQSLQLLFHCEYLALVEYVECVVPLVFATYKMILKQLPNAIYYPGGLHNWGITTFTNVVIFAVLEVCSLFLLHTILKRKFAFSPLYQLAFALETEMYLVQGSLFLEIVILLQYELAHLGADFTFRFAWLHSS